MHCHRELIQAGKNESLQPYLPDCPKFAKDVVHFLRRDIEGQIPDVKHPAAAKMGLSDAMPFQEHVPILKK